MIELIEDNNDGENQKVNPFEGATLEQAHEIWKDVIKGEGDGCPVCERWGKMYKRPIGGTMVRQLLWLCQQNPRDDGWIDVQDTAPVWMLRSPQLGTLRYWGFVIAPHNPGGKTASAGLWKPTDLGLMFAYGRITAPKYKYVYNDTVYDSEGPEVYVSDCLTDKHKHEDILGTSHYDNDT